MSNQSTPGTAESLDELLFSWRNRVDRGCDPLTKEMSPNDREFSRRLRAIQRIEELLIPTMSRPDETSDWSGAAASRSVGRDDENMPPVLPGYGPLEKIARGGMGVVYKAHNLALDRDEAVKTIRTGSFAGPEDLAFFRFEAEATARLTHPNIVTVFSVGEADGRPFLTMRWIDGSSLSNRPRETQLAEAAMLAKVARAVHYAHQRGILHRDLKPHNILVDAAGEPFVADFGIARRLDRNATMTEGCNPVGTPAYMSPEQSRGEPRLTVASDVFSLGTVLYERLTGRLPFDDSNLFEVMRQVRESDPAPPRALNPEIDRDLDAICRKCLEKNPEDRYADASKLAEDLEHYCRGEPVAAQPPGFWDWVRQLSRTRPEPNTNYSWRVAVWFGVMILAINLVIFMLVKSGGPAAGVWVANAAASIGMIMILWWYMLSKFRQLPATERHSLIIAAGTNVVYLALTVAYVPLSLSVPARESLAVFPALAAVCGLGLFILGSTNWSRFFLVGVGVIALAPALAHWPEASPLVFGVVMSTIMWGWAFVKKVKFGRPVLKKS